MINAPVNTYFDVTPMSKIMGYFTEDIDRCDRHFWGCFEWVSHTVIDCVTKVCIAMYFSPVLGIVILVNFYILHRYSAYTKQT